MKGQGREFMEKTKYKYLDESDQNKGLPQPPLVLPPMEGKRVIKLPDPKTVKVNPVTVSEAINRRVSVRAYSQEPLTLGELSYLLWSTQGIKQVTPRPSTLRTVPSAGARHCFETYVQVNRVEGLEPGLYMFLPLNHELQELNLEEGIVKKVRKGCYNQGMVETSAVTFIWTVVAYRMKWRYTERGYRYMHIDAGHVCQNLYLAAETIDSGVCAIAAFEDDEMNRLLGIDGEEQFTIYVATLGRRRS